MSVSLPLLFARFRQPAAASAFLLISLSSVAFARESYQVKVQCPGSNSIEIVRFYADDDMDAFNQAQKALQRSDFKRKNCFIVEIKRS